MSEPHIHDIDDAVMEMLISDREEAEARALAAEAELERVRPWLQWTLRIRGDDCRYDHDDYCQTHNMDERPCPVEQIVDYFAALNDGCCGDGFNEYGRCVTCGRYS